MCNLLLHQSITVVTRKLLRFNIFCQIVQKIGLKTVLNPEMPPNCYGF